MRKNLLLAGVILFFCFSQNLLSAQTKRLYISNDDHTDYMWSANEAGYNNAITTMLDWWTNYNTATFSNPANYRSKWNCDGSLWVWLYEQSSTPQKFDTLIAQIKRGQITVPFSPLVLTYGGMPAEAVLRSMYYGGELERRFNLKLNMATAMENQTMPLGLSSLWKGAGAKYCWHGVCNCDTKMTGFDNRANEIYWYKGLDTNKILLKWYQMDDPGQNYFLGGYAEANLQDNAVDALSAKCNTAKYPYNIAAAFGVGHDALATTTDNLITTAVTKTNAAQQVIVSNEEDFFKDFEATYGASLPTVTKTFGNEWDMNCASIAEISAQMKRYIEKLRTAEAMAAIVFNYDALFMTSLEAQRKQAWLSMGLYWEHSLGFNNGTSGVSMEQRIAFQRRLLNDVTTYVDALYGLAKNNLGNLITNGTLNTRFYVFNPLAWQRTDYADYEYNGSTSIYIKDITTNTEVPFQFITKNGVNFIRVLASNIPSVGYKVFEITPGTGSTSFADAGTNTGNTLENDFFRIDYTNQGVLTSIIDKVNGNKQLVAVTNGKYVNDMGSGTGNAGTATAAIGKVSITVTTQSAAPLAHTTKITLFKNIPRIEIDNTITQNFNDSVRTWSYSFNAASPEVWHEETGAVIKAKLTTNGGHYAANNARYDWSTLNHFAAVNEPSGYGISLSNHDCFFMQLGNSTVTSLDENTAQLNVLAGGTIGGLGITNQGDDLSFNQRFAITTHTAYNAANEMKKALEHQNFMVTGTVVSPANFLLPDEYSLLSSSDPNSLIWAVKPADKDVNSGIITRIWNLSDANVSTTLTYPLTITQAVRSTHVENDIEALPFTAGTKTLQLGLGNNEMKTVRTRHTVTALPVKLISLTANRPAGINNVNWQMAGEENVKEYMLERSTDGRNFTTVSTVTAKNNTYQYTDKNINTALPYYYRVKIINTNGTYFYTYTVYIKPDKETTDLLVFPNPVKNVLHANLILEKQTRCHVQITDTKGALVKTTTAPLFERGYNNYAINVNDLPAGQYFLTINTGTAKYVQPFIKQ